MKPYTLHSLVVPYISSFLFDCNAAILALSIPIYALRLGANLLDIGLIGTSSGLAYTLTAVTFGRVFGRVNRKSLLMFSSLLLSLVAFAYTLVPDHRFLIPLSAVQSFGFGIFWPNIESLVVIRSGPVHMKSALLGYNISWSLGWIIGPLLGGFLLGRYTSNNVFYSIAFLFTIGLILNAINRYVPSYLSEEREGDERGNGSWRFLKLFWLHYGLAFTYAFTTRTHGSFFPTYSTLLDIDPLMIGIILLFAGLTRTITFGFTKILELQIGSRMVTLGPTFLGISMVVTFLGSEVWHFALGCALLGLGSGISYYSALSTILEGKGSSLSLKAGLFEGTVGIGSVLGPFFGGLVSGFDVRYPYALAGTLCFLLFLRALIRRDCQS